MRLEGRAWVVGDDISTDLLYPQVAYNMQTDEAPMTVLSAIRPGWPAQVEKGDLLVGGRNFGMGSARPAALLLKRLGIAACVAESMSALFLRNCVNSGLPPVVCPDITEYVSEGDVLSLDLVSGTVENRTTGSVIQGQALPPFLTEILEAGGIIESLERRGYLPAWPIPAA